MLRMVVTLEVSKLSGWLNADAYCGGSKEGHTCGASYGGVSGQGTRGGAHREHVAHVRDAGGVEAQRLVERRRFLPRIERRACGAR